MKREFSIQGYELKLPRGILEGDRTTLRYCTFAEVERIMDAYSQKVESLEAMLEIANERLATANAHQPQYRAKPPGLMVPSGERAIDRVPFTRWEAFTPTVQSIPYYPPSSGTIVCADAVVQTDQPGIPLSTQLGLPEIA